MRRKQQGFSLLEVVVAFTILALALGALYHSVGGSVRGAQQVERRAGALMMARSLLELYDTIPEGGLSESGTSASGERWALSAVRDGIVPDGVWALYRVDIAVWGAGNVSGEPDVAIATLRPQRIPRPGEGL